MNDTSKIIIEMQTQLKKFKETNEWVRRNQTLLYLSDKIKQFVKKNNSRDYDWLICIAYEQFLKQLDKDDREYIQANVIYWGLKAFYTGGDLFNFFRDMEKTKEEANKEIDEQNKYIWTNDKVLYC